MSTSKSVQDTSAHLTDSKTPTTESKESTTMEPNAEGNASSKPNGRFFGDGNNFFREYKRKNISEAHSTSHCRILITILSMLVILIIIF